VFTAEDGGEEACMSYDDAVSARAASARTTPIDQLELHHLAWEEPSFSSDPYPHFARAREVHPWLATVQGGYMVFDLQAIRDLLVKDDQLRTAFDGIVDIMDAEGTAWGRFAKEQMIALPDREHRVIRSAFASRFTPRSAATLRPIMRQEIDRLLREWAPKGSFDFEEFASYYPIAVMTRMIGAPLEVIPALRSSMETMGLAFSQDSSLLPQLDAAMAQMDDFAFGLMRERRANPHVRGRDELDLLDLLLEAGTESDIDDRQLADLLIFLFVAGYDTSKNVLTYMMHMLTGRPEIYQRCAEDLEYCQKVVEEALRLFTPASTFRATKEDMIYRGVFIPKDTMLFFSINIAAHISPEIAKAGEFNPERTVAPHLRHVGFGLGKHICLGQYIARVQLQEGLHQIARHLRNPRESGTPGWRPFPGVWGIKGLPIAFEPANV
jgi:cytochrome P450